MQRIAHAGLRRQVDHHVETFVGKQLRDRRAIFQSSPHKAEAGVFLQQRQAGLFEADVVVVVQVVQADHLIAPFQQALSQVKTDKSGRSRYQNIFHTQTSPQLLIHSGRFHFVKLIPVDS